jgi:hypothetical protein
MRSYKQPQVMFKLHGVWVPEHLLEQVNAMVAEAHIGKKGWQTRATRRALWVLTYDEDNGDDCGSDSLPRETITE